MAAVRLSPSVRTAVCSQNRVPLSVEGRVPGLSGAVAVWAPKARDSVGLLSPHL